ncbi:YIP1 family protein [Gracilibacillus salitolerans]|uniref:YIP1 family protein n=1 Tax=Gracilibacillus salitolerans TaxID=2663022 RepID=A0A5Q2TH82_9BACI|nr:Yip1 family protein [Gracilibacillus salitolerans]QGH33491.1 YIP1 family protein [Gracilibacillus salitolerans]
MEKEMIKNPFQLIVRPFQSFWELKYELNRKENIILSFIILIALIITNILSSQYAGFVVNIYNPNEMNSIMEIVYVVVPLLFWCIANWSLTTLMDGEGKFVEIFIATCFALTPLVIINFPWILLSNFLSHQEAMFYYLSQSFAVIWFIFLIYVGTMTVHQYTPGKTTITIFLIIIAMGFLAFLSLLFFSLIQQISSFLITIYREFVLRY